MLMNQNEAYPMLMKQIKYNSCLWHILMQMKQNQAQLMLMSQNRHLSTTYISNSNYTLLSDHIPLTTIFGHRSAKLPVRLERLSLCLQSYWFTFGHVAGKHNPSNYYSRYPVDQPGDDSADVAEQYVVFIGNICVPKCKTLAEIASETLNDPVISQIIKCIEFDDWRPVADNVEFRLFYAVRSELSLAVSNIVLRQTRIVLPTALQDRAIQTADVGHRGQTGTKQLLRTKVWFPHMNSKVDNVVRKRRACQ